jgi:hypothetical protein
MAKQTSKNHYLTFERVTYTCVVCKKEVTLPAWGRKRKYCSMACSQAVQMKRAAKKNREKKKEKEKEEQEKAKAKAK